jgi:hypothetical protein
MQETKTQKLPEWKTMFDKFHDLDYGKEITYLELDRCLLNGSIQDRKRYVFEQFKREMLRQENKALENVMNKGYRIANANEHVRLTNREIKRAERRARVACDIILHTDMDRLTEKEKLIAIAAASRVQPILATLIGEQKSLKESIKFKLPEMPRS